MRVALVFVLLAACSKSNPYYCPGHPDDNCTKDADVNAPQGCQTNDDCTNSAKPLCEPTEKICVACLDGDIGACGGATPVCTAEHTCAACASHADCDSRACLPDGSCAMDMQVAYVSAAGSGNACTKENPCPLLADALVKNTPYIKIAADGAAKDTSTVTIDGKTVTILAEPGAILDRDGDGPILDVRSANADVRIYDLTIRGATGAAGADAVLLTPNGGVPKLALTRVTIVSNQGTAVTALGGALTVAQSTITSNLGGGILVSGTGTTFTITNNIIVYNGAANGTAATQLGGIAVTANTSGSKLEWNTIALNQSDGTIYRGGLTCTGAMVSATGNLIYRNSEPDGSGGLKTDDTTQRNATGCQFGNTLAVANDAGNLGFKSPGTPPLDFHLTASSPSTVVGAGGSCTGTDFDGDTRPIDGACDLGADELHP